MQNPARDPRIYHDLQNWKVVKGEKEIKLNGNVA